MEWEQVVSYVVTPFLTLLLTVFHLYLNARFTSLRERVIALEHEVEKGLELHRQEVERLAEETEDMKLNYISRFGEVKDSVYEIKDQILVKLTDLDKKVERQTTICTFIQGLKNK